MSVKLMQDEYKVSKRLLKTSRNLRIDKNVNQSHKHLRIKT